MTRVASRDEDFLVLPERFGRIEIREVVVGTRCAERGRDAHAVLVAAYVRGADAARAVGSDGGPDLGLLLRACRGRVEHERASERAAPERRRSERTEDAHLRARP